MRCKFSRNVSWCFQPNQPIGIILGLIQGMSSCQATSTTFFYFCFLQLYFPNGNSPIGNSGCLPRGKPAATKSHSPTFGACWVFYCFHNPPNSYRDNGIFNVRKDVNASNCIRGRTDTVRGFALKVDLGEKSLAALGNRTCVGGVTVWCSTSWATSHCNHWVSLISGFVSLFVFETDAGRLNLAKACDLSRVIYPMCSRKRGDNYCRRLKAIWMCSLSAYTSDVCWALLSLFVCWLSQRRRTLDVYYCTLQRTVIYFGNFVVHTEQLRKLIFDETEML